MFGGHPAELLNPFPGVARPHTHCRTSYTLWGAVMVFFFDCINARLRRIATTQGIVVSIDIVLLMIFVEC